MRALCCEKASCAIGRGAFAWLPSALCPTLVSVSLSHTRWRQRAGGHAVAVCPYDAAVERVAERAAARTAERCDRAPLSVTHSLSMLSLSSP